MNRLMKQTILRLIQSCICLTLSPLLVAQQVQQGSAAQTTTRADGTIHAPSLSPALADLPDNTKIRLGTVAAASTGTAGDSIRFAVVNDVVVDGVVKVPAGTWVNGIVSDGKRGSHRLDRDGQVTVRARDLKSGRAIQVRLAGVSSDQRGNGWPGSQTDHTLQIAGLIVGALLLIAIMGGDK